MGFAGLNWVRQTVMVLAKIRVGHHAYAYLDRYGSRKGYLSRSNERSLEDNCCTHLPFLHDFMKKHSTSKETIGRQLAHRARHATGQWRQKQDELGRFRADEYSEIWDLAVRLIPVHSLDEVYFIQDRMMRLKTQGVIGVYIRQDLTRPNVIRLGKSRDIAQRNNDQAGYGTLTLCFACCTGTVEDAEHIEAHTERWLNENESVLKERSLYIFRPGEDGARLTLDFIVEHYRQWIHKVVSIEELF